MTGVHVLSDPTVLAVAQERNKSTAQVGLKWLVQQGIALVTASNSAAHIQGDLDIFDFELSDAEMHRLSAVQP